MLKMKVRHEFQITYRKEDHIENAKDRCKKCNIQQRIVVFFVIFTRKIVVFFVGGMPEAVQSFAEEKDFKEVREIQKQILAAYEQDFSKHAPSKLYRKSVWYGIVFPLSLQKKTKSLSTVSCVREEGQRNMNRQLCGFVIVGLPTKSAV